jgi:phosphonate transport system substrate-binding protein
MKYINMKRISLWLLLVGAIAGCNPVTTDTNKPEPSSTNQAAVAASQSGDTEAALALATKSAVPFDAKAKPLTLAYIPQENPEKLIGDIKVISKYLESQLGFPVKGYVTQDHTAAVEALRSGEADISFMGGLPYVLAHRQVGVEAILSEVYRGKPIYHGRIFVRKDSGINNVQDLKGKSIAFADPISESGYLYPLDIFVRAGLIQRQADPQTYFKRVYFAGGYQQALQAVVNGYADAAGVSQYTDLTLLPEEFQQVKWIAESAPIPSHQVCVRKGLEPDRVQAFRTAMLKLNQPEYKVLLKYVYNPDGYVEASHKDYASVEQMAYQYGFLKPEGAK